MIDSPNFERGLQLYQLGRYESAIDYFKTELNQNIDNFDAKLYLTYSYLKIEDFKKVKELSKELRKAEPNYAPVYDLYAQIALNENKLDDALNYIDTAIGLDVYNSYYFGIKSYIYIHKKKFKEALEFANKGLNIDAKDRTCLNARATSLTKLNRKEEAKQTIENLLNDDPEDAHSQANVGWTELENNNISKALIHFKTALQLNPNNEYARDGMATAIKAKNKIYNLFLRYNFWMAKQSGKNQFFFIIGIYVAYRFSLKILSTSGLTILAVPLIIIYLLFALGTWIMEPLSNMILNFDKYGQYLLDKNAKLSGWLMFSLLSISLFCYALSFVFKSDILILFSLTSLAAILPISRAPQNSKNSSRIFDYSYGVIILLTSTVGLLIGYNYDDLLLAVIVLFIGYTWLGGLIF